MSYSEMSFDPNAAQDKANPTAVTTAFTATTTATATTATTTTTTKSSAASASTAPAPARQSLAARFMNRDTSTLPRRATLLKLYSKIPKINFISMLVVLLPPLIYILVERFVFHHNLLFIMKLFTFLVLMFC
jgi:hypothetical protein